MAITDEHIDIAIETAVKFGATKVLLFGSALDNPSEANDLDLGVLGIPPNRFFLFGGTLEDIIRKWLILYPLELDNPFLRYITEKGKYIYEK